MSPFTLVGVVQGSKHLKLFPQGQVVILGGFSSQPTLYKILKFAGVDVKGFIKKRKGQ